MKPVKNARPLSTVKTCAALSTNVNVTRLDAQLSEIQSAPKVKNSELSTQVPAAKSSNASASHHNAQPPQPNVLSQVTLLVPSILVLAVHHTNAHVTRLHVHQSKDHNVTSVNNASSLMKMLAVLNTLASVIQPDVHNHQSAQPATSCLSPRVPVATHMNVSAMILLVHQLTFQHAQMLLV